MKTGASRGLSRVLSSLVALKPLQEGLGTPGTKATMPLRPRPSAGGHPSARLACSPLCRGGRDSRRTPAGRDPLGVALTPAPKSSRAVLHARDLHNMLWVTSPMRSLGTPCDVTLLAKVVTWGSSVPCRGVDVGGALVFLSASQGSRTESVTP